MGLIQTILGNKIKVYFMNFDTQGTVFSIDASMSESHNRASPASQFEIENGTTISDNIVIKPFKLQLKGIISDTPISIGSSLLTTAVSVPSPGPGVLSSAGTLVGAGLVAATQGGASPSKKAYAQLLSIQQAKNPFTVVTSLKSYPNMWIEDLTIPRDPQTGQVLMFDLNLIQLIIVSPQTTVTQIFQNPDLSANNANAGRQQTSGVPNEYTQGHNLEQSTAFSHAVRGG